MQSRKAIEGILMEKKLPKPETVKRYVAALKENDPKKRITAMRKLSDVVCAGQADLNALVTPGVPDLIALLSDPSWKVRAWAVRLLGRIGPGASAAVPHLVLALQDCTIPVRECAAYALGRLGEEAVIRCWNKPCLILSAASGPMRIWHCGISITRMMDWGLK